MLGEISVWSDEMKKDYLQKYGIALEQAANELLTKNQIAYLIRLPCRKELFIAGRHILLCHGSPWDRDEYVYPDASDEVLVRCAEGDFDVVVMGHTHYPLIKQYGSTLILNPGSVGQPRNNQSAASWALLDLNALTVQLRHVTYDIVSVIAEAHRNDPKVPYLAEVLERRQGD
jgi:predicted phosphodiesterase